MTNHCIHDLRPFECVIQDNLAIPGFHKYEQSHIIALNKGLKSIILLKDIIFIKSESNYSYFHLKDGKSMLTSKTLKYWCEKIQHPNFIRVHASYLINKSEIKEIIKRTAKITMSNGLQASYSRSFDIKTLTSKTSKIIKLR